jgi:hypothetical protein
MTEGMKEDPFFKKGGRFDQLVQELEEEGGLELDIPSPTSLDPEAPPAPPICFPSTLTKSVLQESRGAFDDDIETEDEDHSMLRLINRGYDVSIEDDGYVKIVPLRTFRRDRLYPFATPISTEVTVQELRRVMGARKHDR